LWPLLAFRRYCLDLSFPTPVSDRPARSWRRALSVSVHVVPLRIYFIIFASLMILTAITVAVAYYDLGPLNTIVALSIAVTKATLVILYFMHVRYSPSLTKLVVAGSFLWLFIMLSITMSDYVSRGW